MQNVSALIKVQEKPLKFILSKDVSPNTDVTFRTMWRGKKWSFGGYVADDKRTVHITLISSK